MCPALSHTNMPFAPHLVCWGPVSPHLMQTLLQFLICICNCTLLNAFISCCNHSLYNVQKNLWLSYHVALLPETQVSSH